MAGLTGLLRLGGSALAAQQAGVQAAGENVSNAGTPGYTRRSIRFESLGSGAQSGAGVSVRAQSAMRAHDALLERQARVQSGVRGEAQARQSVLTDLERVLAPLDGDVLGESIDGLFAGFVGLASAPDDGAVRVDLLARAERLAAAFNSVSRDLDTMRRAADGAVADAARDATVLAREVAELNRQVVEAEASGGEASALRDRRDASAKALVELVGGEVVVGSDGAVKVLTGGVTLVDGQKWIGLGVTPGTGPRGASTLVFLDDSGAPSATLGAPTLDYGASGGRLGGILNARDGVLSTLHDRLDTLAFEVATRVNAVHAAGVGLDGVGGRALFRVGAAASGAAAAMSVSTDVAGTPGALAAARDAASLPGDNRNALAMSALGRERVLSGGIATFGDVWLAIGTDAANEARVANADALDATDRAAQIDALRESAVGVSVDEELVQLTAFQRGFEAAARVVRTADEMMQTILQM